MERLQRKLEFAKHKEAPIPLPLGSNILPDALYLYGVDYMSTNDIKTYFERYSTDKEALEVKWINDSACIVKFEGEDQAKRAIKEQALSSSLQEKPEHQHL